MSASAPFAYCRRRGLWILALLAGLLALPVRADVELSSLPADLTELSLDDLLKIEVTTVSKRAEPLQQAAAAVYVITGEDLHRRGVRSIAEALRAVPGLHVARVGQGYAISARGFNSSSADKLEVLLDGRSVYTPLFSGVFWDVLDTFLPDIERIEVIRGPGATLWGANAVNGVINIITRRAGDTTGKLVHGGGGSHDQAYAGARQGWQLGEEGHARLYAQYRGDDNGERASGAEPANGFVLRQAGFRSDFAPRPEQQLTVSGDWYDGTTESTTGDSELAGGDLLAHWQLRQSERAAFSAGAYFSHSERDIPIVFSEQRDTYDLELEQSLGLGQHELLFGLGYRHSRDDTGDPPRIIIFEPADRTLETYDGFVQDQLLLAGGRGTLTLGSKFEHNDFTGFEWQPSLHLGWNLRDSLFGWAGISRAVRTPNRLDSDIAFFCPEPNGFPGFCGPGTRIRIGNPDLDAETLIAYESGLRWRPTATTLLELALFHNDYDRLRSQEPAAPFVRLGNGLRATGSGGELNVSWRPRASLRLGGYYSYLDLDVKPRGSSGDTRSANAIENGNPRHMAGLELGWAPSSRWHFSAFLRHVDELPASRVPAYTELDLRAAWRLRPDLELALVGENLLDDQHPEFGGNPATRIEVQRQGLVQIRWWPQ